MFGDKNKLEMVFIPDDRHIKRKLRNIPNKGIIMDPFNKLSRNVDYLDNDDEFYSDDHLYYKEDGITSIFRLFCYRWKICRRAAFRH